MGYEMIEKRVKITVITSSILDHPGLGKFRIKTELAKASKDRVPLDYNHNEEEVVGYVENFQYTADAITADGVVLIGDESSDAAKTFAQNIDGGVPFEASAFLDLSEAEGVELEDGVVEWSGALIRGVAICPYGTDRNTVVSLKLGDSNFNVRLNATKEGEKMEEERKTGPGSLREELETMISEFGLERGVAFFRKGLTIEEAREIDYQELKARRLNREEEEDEKTQCAAVEEDDLLFPEEDEEEKQPQAALKADLAKLAQEISKIKATLRRGDPNGLSQSFQREEVPAQRQKTKLSPLAAAAEKFRKIGVKKD